MQHTETTILHRWRAVGWVMAAIAVFWARMWLWQAVTQLFAGVVVALAALPLMKKLERWVSPGAAASLALLGMGAGLATALLVLAPSLVRQGRLLISLLPGLMDALESWIFRGQEWLRRSGILMDTGLQNAVLDKGQEALGAAVPTVMGWMRGMAGGVGRWMLAPAFAYYFLRDRRRIAQWLIMLVPGTKREMAVRILREMRREVAGYLRGQLLISTMVAAATAIGLLLCGVEAWLFLGFAMGVLELIPYAGPLLGGMLAVLFALPGGWQRVMWTLGVVIVVQQAEGSLLSPQLMSGATRLHPVAIILCVMVGGAAAGMVGILLSVPAVLCVRAALRVMAQRDVKSL